MPGLVIDDPTALAVDEAGNRHFARVSGRRPGVDLGEMARPEDRVGIAQRTRLERPAAPSLPIRVQDAHADRLLHALGKDPGARKPGVETGRGGHIRPPRPVDHDTQERHGLGRQSRAGQVAQMAVPPQEEGEQIIVIARHDSLYDRGPDHQGAPARPSAPRE